MDEFFFYVKLIGAILGIIAFFWNVLNTMKIYLQIDIKIEKDDNKDFTIKTSIRNRSTSPKDIKNAFVIISPEHESVMNAAEDISKSIGSKTNHNAFEYTNDLISLEFNNPVYSADRFAYIPLPFYYLENVRIGDEELSYRASIDKSRLNNGVYSARLFVFHESRLHRTTQDLFRITESEKLIE